MSDEPLAVSAGRAFGPWPYAGYACDALAAIAVLREAGIRSGVWPRHAVPPRYVERWEAARARTGGRE